MNRIEKRFGALRARGEKAFIAYITAGDPTLERTEELVLALEGAGVDIIELGIPFSDPIADGTVNQEAAQRALVHGTSLHDVVKCVGRLRARTEIPIVFFTYFNPLFAYGMEAFGEEAKAAGVDGVLCVDLPPEESGDYKAQLDVRGIATVYLLAPTSTDARIERIVRESTGFIYYVSRVGTTGVRADVEESIPEMVAKIRAHSNKPVAVGFGVSTPEQAHQVAGYADGVIVGSAIVRLVGELGDAPDMPAKVAGFVAPLAKATKER